ncbi:hypothetical protein EKO23_15995 [Nocardioides guangzhouensis]|uniref:Uncharacterized protein n=1 Tax=Nocardioides guangzhouensis TaxID=2497878 RepID=A0A4V1XYT2_9ACTN|nr:hypothetical protein [Nocardioides guangzhouensis]RYP84339.1 hypothetical protein EKO23_15995 [Nocardioides guangzhouensis]
MSDVASSSTVELLQHLHGRLDAHFTALGAARATLEPSSPVFALEHDLPEEDLDLLKEAVRAAISDYYLAHYEATWLPFVVYAAEMGYGYVGEEYWTTFSSLTPRWTSQERSTIRDWFVRFHNRYGGARPTGAWASHFTIISWPITHAVLPVYLQRHLAKLLFDFSGALTSELLDDPETLGLRLARRASGYTERFRIFCENTTLVGQVAAALLSGENEPTPYLTGPTLARIVDGLSQEQQARRWLRSAQQSAHRVRGFRPTPTAQAAAAKARAQARATDPRLFLRLDNVWNAYAELPDMTPLSAGLSDVYGQLRMSRAHVSGGDRHIPPSGLLYPGQSVRFVRWPRPDEPFLRLERADDATNRILADQCVMTPGPWWLFRRQGTGLAVEVKGKFVRPGHRYVLIGTGSAISPAVSWCTARALSAEGARAYELTVPEQVSEADAALLMESGIALVSNVAIRPVGIVASSWDGEGDVEWLAGEPAILGIRSDLAPRRCRVTIGGAVYFLDWTPGESEMLFSLQGLEVGTHVASVCLLGDGERQLTSGSLVITIRDPQIRPEGAAIGEGIRLLAAPARPTLSELWDDRAHISIDGPTGAEAEITVSLRGHDGVPIADVKRSIHLPLDETTWTALAKGIRTDQRFSDAYDDAEVCVLTVAREGVGFATLTCDRGFQPLRWRFTRAHDGQVVARLVDRTDGGDTTVEFYDVETPLVAVRRAADEEIAAPPLGGLVVARSGESTASLILPTQPNAILRQRRTPRPSVSATTSSPKEVRRLIDGHARWVTAELPADAFAVYQQQLIGDAIARAIGTLIGGSHWVAVERKLAGAQDAADYLEEMQGAVGISTAHKELASAIAYSLYKWLSAADLLLGFNDVIGPHLAASGLGDHPTASRFLLMLAGRPGFLADWDDEETALLLARVIQTPVLYRAARFAVLGTRALNDADGVERSF